MSRKISGFDVVAAGCCCGLLGAAILAATTRSRQESYSYACSSNLHQVSSAMQAFLADSSDLYPPSYLYPSNANGEYDLMNQPADAPFGIVHWSWLMFGEGAQDWDLFRCPAMRNGGVPRTNPGPLPWNWELGQADWLGQSQPNEHEDRQAPWLAYVANAAILPANKFTSSLSGGPRVNVHVSASVLSAPANTILLTEFADDWRLVSNTTGPGAVSTKSHRPINPFYHLASGFNEYSASPQSQGFIYGLPADQVHYGLLPLAQQQSRTNLLDSSSGTSPVNAVGRHHPGGDDQFEGTANFLFADGSVRNRSVLQTVRDREWGDRYYSLTGSVEVLNMEPAP